MSNQDEFDGALYAFHSCGGWVAWLATTKNPAVIHHFANGDQFSNYQLQQQFQREHQARGYAVEWFSTGDMPAPCTCGTKYEIQSSK